MFLNKPELGTTFEQLSGLSDSRVETAPTPVLSLSRRGFVFASSGLGLGLVLAACSPGGDGTGPANGVPDGPGPLTDVTGGDATPSLWIEILGTGKVKITVHRSEMGQQVWTSMAQIVADELEADWSDVEIVQALGDPKYGDQNTDGSRSVRYNFHRLRVAGAAMRTMLEHAAAGQWKVNPQDVRAELGKIVRISNGQILSYGELSTRARELAVPTEAEITLKDRKDWRYIGKEISSLTVEQVVRGQGTYGIDVQVDGMVYAVIARPPHIFGALGNVDARAAEAVPGVLLTVRLPDATAPAMFQPVGGVAVIATDTWAAIQGRHALEIDWIAGPSANHNSETYDAELAAAALQPGRVRRERGDALTALAADKKRLTASYHVPNYAHSAMEPPSATARWNGDELECWACVQDPQNTRGVLAGVFDIGPEKIVVHATWLGGAFGRKSKPDFVVEAALLAKEVGKPVKVTWTREDDLSYDYYHAVSAQYLEASLKPDGKCNAFLHRTVFPTISSTFTAGANEASNGEMGLGATDNPFDVPNLRIESGKADAHLRIGWLRSVSNIHHAFAVQSFAAEMAYAARTDQKDYLLDLIGPPRIIKPNEEGSEYANYDASQDDYPIDTARLRHVGKLAAEMAGWGRTLPAGHGLGMAIHRSFLTYVATVIEVAVSADGALSIPGVWIACDAGTVVNPRHVKAQMEGGTLFGLSNALYGEISAQNGQVVQKNFPDWRLMRMFEAPHRFDVEIVASTERPGGVGEPGTPSAAPALTNAIFAATGLRIRRLPILGPYSERLVLDRPQAT